MHIVDLVWTGVDTDLLACSLVPVADRPVIRARDQLRQAEIEGNRIDTVSVTGITHDPAASLRSE